MYNTVNEAAKKPQLWIPLLGAIPPIALPIAVIGGVALAAIMIFRKGKAKDQPLAMVKKPLGTVPQPLKQPLLNNSSTVKSTVMPYRENPVLTLQPTVTAIDGEALRQVTVRKYMSDLGKKSAEARARKRLEGDG